LTVAFATGAAGAQTVIDFDDLPSPTVVTNQYPEATFSSNNGELNTAFSFATAHSLPNILCSGTAQVTDCVRDTFIDFTEPVSNLKFWAIEANHPGVTARFNVFESGRFAETVNFVSLGQVGAQLVDLSAFANVTRLEIVDILIDPSENGIGWDTFSFSTSEECAADCNSDGSLNILDFVCFQGLYQAQSQDADCNGDGALNILDFVCFQGVFVDGCD
jgi:hypothetical protein